MAQRNHDHDTSASTEHADDARPKTWWDRHGGVVFAAGALVIIVLLVVFNMK